MQTHARPSAAFGRASSQASSVASRGAAEEGQLRKLVTFSRADSLARAGGTSPGPWGCTVDQPPEGCQAPWALGGVGPSCRQSVPGGAAPGATRPRATLGGCVTWPESRKAGPRAHHGQDPLGPEPGPCSALSLCPRQPRCPPPGLAGCGVAPEGSPWPPQLHHPSCAAALPPFPRLQSGVTGTCRAGEGGTSCFL